MTEDSGLEKTQLNPCSTAPGTLVSMQEGRRKTSLPQFLQRRGTTDAGSSQHNYHPHLPHVNVNVGHALKRIKKVVFASMNHLHHESERPPQATILTQYSPTSSSDSPTSSPQLHRPPSPTATKNGVRGAAARVKGPHVSRPRSSAEISIDSRCSDLFLESDEEEEGGVTVGPGCEDVRRRRANCDALVATVSALYCKLLVVTGLAFPLSEVISSDIPPFFYESFYIYLYSCSILFLLCVYIFLLKDAYFSDSNSTSKLSRLSNASVHRIGRLLKKDSRGSAADPETASQISRSSHHKPYMVMVASYGSFYLRMGAVLFGIGSMIYSGLEMSQYFDDTDEADCVNVLGAVTPGLRLAFIFIQMYFIFLNASMSINRHKLLARFGLMHMVGTNLCVWLHVVIQETKHELVHLLSMVEGGGRHRRGVDDHGSSNHLHSTTADNHTTDLSHGLLGASSNDQLMEDLEEFYEKEGSHLTKCARSDIMGQLVDSASPFLFPCTIEYSLICAATLYVMWKNLNKLNTVYVMRDCSDSSGESDRKHQYSVDCARASKGLFLGILVFVASIISLILFFVFINQDDTHDIAVLGASMSELVLYSVTVLALTIGMVQIQRLKYHSDRSIELDNILLVVAQTGVYLYRSFHIIGAHFASDLYSFATSVMSIIQVTLQTMFILDASCRQAYRSNQLRDKPGREVVTFLLICNLAMWCVTTFETSRSDAHPKQLHFFGFWAWTIISHVSMPLAIFYRFHSTVCLCEIWKRAYKYKANVSE